MTLAWLRPFFFNVLSLIMHFYDQENVLKEFITLLPWSSRGLHCLDSFISSPLRISSTYWYHVWTIRMQLK